MIAIKTEGLKKQFGDVIAVNDLCLEIMQGELYALLGVNGAGKTTTIKMLSCLINPTQGDISIMGYAPKTQAQKIKQLIGVSPQETAVAPNLTIRENIELIAEIYGFEKAELKQRTDEVISKLKLSDFENKKAKNLSGGYQRRLSIAMALVTSPKILFLDEPTLGLDVLARRELWKIISSLKENTTIILTTHYMEEAENLSDRIGIMAKGKLVAQGSAQELKEMAHTTDFEEAFVALATKEN